MGRVVRIRARPRHSRQKTVSALPSVTAMVALSVTFAFWSQTWPPRTDEVTQAAYDFRHCEGSWSSFCVIDGDTLYLDGVRLRIADIDAPEVFSPECTREAEIGRQATQRMLQLVNAGPFSIETAGSRDEDVYGRKLRILVRDGRSLGGILVEEGLARDYRGPDRGWCG